MSHKTFIIDANVIVKLLYDEADSDTAQAFLKYCVKQEVRLLAPEHFTYELMSVARRLDIDLEKAFDLLVSFKQTMLTLVTPQKQTWLLAEKIAKHGHPKSGFPSIYDSIYHALALEVKSEFITADRRHIAKAESFGGVVLLKDWENVG